MDSVSLWCFKTQQLNQKKDQQKFQNTHLPRCKGIWHRCNLILIVNFHQENNYILGTWQKDGMRKKWGCLGYFIYPDIKTRCFLQNSLCIHDMFMWVHLESLQSAGKFPRSHLPLQQHKKVEWMTLI